MRYTLLGLALCVLGAKLARFLWQQAHGKRWTPGMPSAKEAEDYMKNPPWVML